MADDPLGGRGAARIFLPMRVAVLPSFGRAYDMAWAWANFWALRRVFSSERRRKVSRRPRAYDRCREGSRCLGTGRQAGRGSGRADEGLL